MTKMLNGIIYDSFVMYLIFVIDFYGYAKEK